MNEEKENISSQVNYWVEKMFHVKHCELQLPFASVRLADVVRCVRSELPGKIMFHVKH